jgi:hypothetical protein
MSKRLEEIALEHGLCNCDEAYKNRNLTAPDCPFHAFAVSEAMEQYAREVAQASLERAIEDALIVCNYEDKEKDFTDEHSGWFYFVDKQSITNPDNITLL